MEKMVPQSVEVEQSVLGSILIDPEAIAQIADFLRPSDFYRKSHGFVYKAMLSLYQQHQLCDPVTVLDYLERQNQVENCGGHAYIIGLMNESPNAYNVEEYARIVKRDSDMRKLIKAAGEIASMAYERDENALEKSEELLFQLSMGKQSGQVTSLADAVDRFMMKLNIIHEKHQQGVVSGLPTHFTALDQILGGLQPSDLITLAARPAMGKTSLCLNIAYQIMGDTTRDGKNVLMFSLEMGEEQLVRRLMSMESRVNQVQLRNGSFEETSWEGIVAASDKLRGGRFWIDDTPGLSLTDMRSRARRTMQEYGIDLIIVDYMQLMHAHLDSGKSPENRVQEVSMLSQGLKNLARELNIPVLSLAQLSRAVEGRADKVPQLSDLRESGTIEQDSDVVMFIHRDVKGNPNILNIIVAKHRNGPIGVAPMFFNAPLTRFENLSPDQIPDITPYQPEQEEEEDEYE